MITATVTADRILGPMFPWEVPDDFPLWSWRWSLGYLQLIGMPDENGVTLIDVLAHDRSMWE